MVQYQVNASEINGVAISGTAAASDSLVASSATAAAWAAGLELQAAIAESGHALINGTGTILQWTAPSDGNQHRVLVFASLDVTSLETGGAVGFNFTTPDGTSSPFQPVFAAALAASAYAGDPLMVIVEPGSTVFLNQTTALTGGAAKVWAEIWGS